MQFGGFVQPPILGNNPQTALHLCLCFQVFVIIDIITYLHNIQIIFISFFENSCIAAMSYQYLSPCFSTSMRYSFEWLVESFLLLGVNLKDVLTCWQVLHIHRVLLPAMLWGQIFLQSSLEISWKNLIIIKRWDVNIILLLPLPENCKHHIIWCLKTLIARYGHSGIWSHQ